MAERALVAEIDFQSALFVRSAVAGRVDVQSFLLDVSEKPAEPAVAAALQVATGIPVKCLDQVRGWEGRPEGVSGSGGRFVLLTSFETFTSQRANAHHFPFWARSPTNLFRQA